MKYPIVSVIVLNYNNTTDIDDCLESLLHQNYPQYEIIVVDNGSTDGSADHVAKKFPGLQLIRNKTNAGFAAGNNAGIRKAKGELIALFNNDAVADKNWLREIVHVAQSSGKIGIVGGKVLLKNPKGKLAWTGGRLRMCPPTGLNITEEDEQQYVDWISGCSLLFKRELLDKVGYLDEGYFMYFEDIDFCLQAKRAGYEVVYAPQAVVWHGESTTTSKDGRWRYRTSYESRFRFTFKNLSLLQQICSVFYIFLVSVPYHLLKKKEAYPIDFFRAFSSALKKLSM